MATATKTKSKKANNKKKTDFHKKLVLFKYILGLFGIDTTTDEKSENYISRLAQNITDPELEGIDEEKRKTKIFLALTNKTVEYPGLTLAQLEDYDNNIVRHTIQIEEKREQKIKWKYFQYLALLFTEIYLDKYFTDKAALITDINNFREEYNKKVLPDEPISEFIEDDLNKVAFWNATGSGKTLIMHVNILQYQHYIKYKGKESDLNKVILITPNEGLSKQHEDELELSSIYAEIFQKEAKLLLSSLKPVEIIEITKLGDETREKTVSVEEFTSNNLVLVDEGHRGGSAGQEGPWMRRRNALCENGFSFEYSATFGQTVAKDNELSDKYAKCILFDYSYKYFYGDGYGKDYRILNLEDDTDQTRLQQYLIACLLAYFQQIKIYNENKKDLTPFMIEKPLWIFVGSSVNAVRTVNKKETSDVLDILYFVAEFIKDKAKSIQILDDLIKRKDGFLDSRGLSIFENKFTYLIKQNLNGEELYSQILKSVFNCSIDQAQLHIDNLKGVSGEIGLRIGDNDYFGVINVGDSEKLAKLCDDNRFNVNQKDFADSLFRSIDKKDSPINMLIGSKKFTEGWSSWRVSTMGLMNVGRSEGSQIIQLFGRGVRLKGYDFCLKRSRQQYFAKAPKNIETVETLNIFGIKADYMKEFKNYLELEGLPSNEKILEFCLPTISNLGNVKTPLKFPRIKDDLSFRKNGGKITLELPPDKFISNPTVIDLYSKVQTLESLKSSSGENQKNEERLREEHLAFLDYDEIFFELERYKYEKAFYNLSLSKDRIIEILNHRAWYVLKIPKNELEFNDFEKVKRWQEFAISIMKKYCERFYNYKKNDWEKDYREFVTLDDNDPNMVKEYKIFIDESRTDIIEKIVQLKEQIDKKQLIDIDFANFKTINWCNHLYKPLICIEDSEIKVSPVSLNAEEMLFVEDLKKYYENNAGLFNGKELYLLRNQGKKQGVGFFEANNFHPDFVLWLINDGKQYISFVDPKGLMHISGLQDPKIQFHKTIKDIERDMGDPNVVFNSFIISNSIFEQLSLAKERISKDAFEDNHVIFQEDGNYISKLIAKVL